jgi:putative sigma-54 modulation protein
MKQYAEEKAGKLPRYYDRIESIDVICDHEKMLHKIEVVVRVDHRHTFVSHVEAENFNEAVDLVIDKTGRQLREHKEKYRNRKHVNP